MNLKTTNLLNDLSNVKSENNLDKLLKQNFNSVDLIEFTNYFNNICLEKNIKKSTIVNESGLSRSYCYEVLRGEKIPDRDSTLKLAFAGKLDLEQTNRILKLTNNSILYPKIMRDYVLIFCINNAYTLIQADICLDEHGFNPLSNA